MPSAICSAPWARPLSLHWLVRHCLVSIFVRRAKTTKKNLVAAAKRNSVARAVHGADGSCAHFGYRQPQELLDWGPLRPKRLFPTSACSFNVCAATESLKKQMLTLYCRKAM